MTLCPLDWSLLEEPCLLGGSAMEMVHSSHVSLLAAMIGKKSIK